MLHNNTALMAVHPTRLNPTTFQKTMAVNDYYFHGEEGWRFPLGNLQLLGKLQAGMLTANQRIVPRSILSVLTRRSVDWWVMSEDLPDPENRVVLGAEGRLARSALAAEQFTNSSSFGSSGKVDAAALRISSYLRSADRHRDELPSVRDRAIWN